MVTYKWKDSEGWKLKQFTSFTELYSLAKANPGVHFIHVGKAFDK